MSIIPWGFVKGTDSLSHLEVPRCTPLPGAGQRSNLTVASSLPKPEEGLGLVLLCLLASCSSWGTEGQLRTGTEEIQEDTLSVIQ